MAWKGIVGGHLEVPRRPATTLASINWQHYQSCPSILLTLLLNPQQRRRLLQVCG